MDQILELEKEIKKLRQKLREKENELHTLKRNLNLNQSGVLQNGSCDGNQKVTYGVLPKWAIERYSRQILLREIGVPGQSKICSARVLIVGAGGLGCPAAMYLAGSGVGEIGIVDYDVVEITNIHRQLLHKEENVGMNKAESAAQAIRSINSQIRVTPYKVQLDSSNALQIASKYDLVLDCTDNAPTRYLLSDLCVLAKLPLISGSALKLEGQLTVYCYRSALHSEDKTSTYRGPCYRCVFATPPSPDAMGSCSQHGVAGPVPGTIGTLQAMEAIKLIIGHPSTNLLVERMLIIDVDDMSCRVVKLRQRNPSCAVCSDTPTITHLVDYEAFCKTLAKEKKHQDPHKKTEKRKREKEKRMTGQSYYGFRTHTEGDKTKYIQDVLKSERKLGRPCNSEICANSTTRYCSKLTDIDRETIFAHFWRLDWSRKKDFVKSLITTCPAKRRRTTHKDGKSRKGDSKLYNLVFDGEKIPVCRVTFLNTLGIKEAMVRCWLANETKPRTTKTPIKSLSVISYIDDLPKIDYNCKCHQNIRYINYNVKNQFQLYNVYTKAMISQGVTPASRKTFAKVLSRKNLRELELKILPPINRITAKDFSILRKEKSTLLIDVRNESEFDMCHIVGAHNLPIDNVESKMEDLLGRVQDNQGAVVFVCRRGNDSQIAAKILLSKLPEEHKYKIKDMVGGLHAWAQDIDNTFPVY